LDDPASRQVPTLQALNFAKKHKMDFCEVSAKSGANVEVALRRLIVSVAFSLAEEDDFRMSIERNRSEWTKKDGRRQRCKQDINALRVGHLRMRAGHQRTA
jgi:hypothetical protein